jgi:GTP cyclohydrolase I
MKPSDIIRGRVDAVGARYFANDNIAKFINDEERIDWEDEVTSNFEKVLKSLVIDTWYDPNSRGTARRLAKMYINEIMSGRYEEKPAATAFPNKGEHKYEGLLVVRAEIKTTCAHHLQPVRGICYIGIIPNGKVIGLSKYVRIVQWCAARGTLQEELCNMIASEIMKSTDCEDVGVYMALRHGCMENRGILAHSSLTQTTVLHGQFKESDVKKEFMDNVKLQQSSSKDD